MSTSKSTVIPNALVAKDVKTLRRLMLATNGRLSAFLKYDIMWVESEKKWYAWYYEDIIEETRVKPSTKGEGV